MWGWNENPWDRDRDRWSSSYGGEWSSKGWKGGGKYRPFGQGKGITINIGDLSSIQAQQQAQSLQQHQHAIAQNLMPSNMFPLASQQSPAAHLQLAPLLQQNPAAPSLQSAITGLPMQLMAPSAPTQQQTIDINQLQLMIAQQASNPSSTLAQSSMTQIPGFPSGLLAWQQSPVLLPGLPGSSTDPAPPGRERAAGKKRRPRRQSKESSPPPSSDVTSDSRDSSPDQRHRTPRPLLSKSKQKIEYSKNKQHSSRHTQQRRDTKHQRNASAPPSPDRPPTRHERTPYQSHSTPPPHGSVRGTLDAPDRINRDLQLQIEAAALRDEVWKAL